MTRQGDAPHRLLVRRAGHQRPDHRPPPRAGDAAPTRAPRRRRGRAAPDHQHTHIDGFGNLVSYLAAATARAERHVDERCRGGGAAGRPARRVGGDAGAAGRRHPPDGLLARQCALDSPLVVGDDALAAHASSVARRRAPAARRRRRPDPAHLRRLRLRPGFTDVTTPPMEVLHHRRGCARTSPTSPSGACAPSVARPLRERVHRDRAALGEAAGRLRRPHAGSRCSCPAQVAGRRPHQRPGAAPPPRDGGGEDYGDVTPVGASCSGRRSTRRSRSRWTSSGSPTDQGLIGLRSPATALWGGRRCELWQLDARTLAAKIAARTCRRSRWWTPTWPASRRPTPRSTR